MPTEYTDAVWVHKQSTGQRIVVTQVGTGNRRKDGSMIIRWGVWRLDPGVSDLIDGEIISEGHRTRKAACDWVALKALEGLIYS